MLTKLDYGVPTDKEGIQLRLGVEKGFFADEGVDLNIVVLFGGPEIAAAYDSGRLGIGELGTPPGVTAMAKGHRFRIVASGVRGRAVQSFVARKGIGDWADLKGCTSAALTIGSCSYWFMRLVLQERGLDPDRDLRLVGLGERYPQVLDLFRSGELDAAVLAEPNVSLGEAEGLFRVMQELTAPEFLPTMQWSIVVANEAFIRDRPEIIQAVLRASKRSYEFCRDHPSEWAGFAADWYGVDLESIRHANDRELAGLRWDCRPDMEGIQQAIELQRRLGAIDRAIDARDLVDERFVPG